MPCPLLFYCVSELSPIPVLSTSQFYGFCACHSLRDLWSPRVLKNIWFLLAGALLPVGAGNGQKGALLLPEALLGGSLDSHWAWPGALGPTASNVRNGQVFRSCGSPDKNNPLIIQSGQQKGIPTHVSSAVLVPGEFHNCIFLLDG